MALGREGESRIGFFLVPSFYEDRGLGTRLSVLFTRRDLFAPEGNYQEGSRWLVYHNHPILSTGVGTYKILAYLPRKIPFMLHRFHTKHPVPVSYP